MEWYKRFVRKQARKAIKSYKECHESNEAYYDSNDADKMLVFVFCVGGIIGCVYTCIIWVIPIVVLISYIAFKYYSDKDNAMDDIYWK